MADKKEKEKEEMKADIAVCVIIPAEHQNGTEVLLRVQSPTAVHL